jgi:ATP-dependent Lon protease
LLPKQIEANGLKPDELSIADAALIEIIRRYTRESGVRNLERELAKICRKVVKEITVAAAKAAQQALADALVEPKPLSKSASVKRVKPEQKSKSSVHVVTKTVEKFLGVPRHRFGRAEERDEIGLVTGLAWTEVGGEMLNIEASVLSGKGKLQQTGQLGDVMQESIHAALSVVRARCENLGIDPDFHQNVDIHVHVPEGATPKDGPSAGIAMCTALVSALTKIPVRADIAMTGEITLRGRVLPIGGLKEKLLAAVRAGIKHVLIPEENAKDLPEIPDNIKANLKNFTGTLD